MLDFQTLAEIRTAVRYDEYAPWFADWEERGGCSLVSEELEETHGLFMDGGCYIDGRKHIAHYWNKLPDGRILDVTADQFGEPWPGVRVTAGDDPRYDGLCDCGGVDG
jgi:hypothetical protein